MSQKSSKPSWNADNFDFGWVNSSFENSNDVFQEKPVKSTTKTAKRKRQVGASSRRKVAARPEEKRGSTSSSWNEIFQPSCKDDLAVHPKKVAEVADWLKSCMENCQASPILLLTGPAGSGKTATIRALAKDMRFEINEWSSSVFEGSSNTMYIEGVRQRDDALVDLMRQSQTSIFRNFILRANKYSSLFAEHCDRVILVEEFPNVFLREPSIFHDTLRRYCKMAKCPIVFIMSESKIGNSLESQLFPKSLQLELKMHQINFNPVAPTMLSKTLKRIASSVECNVDNVDGIVADSMGDIRNAVNTLQFMSTAGTGSFSKSSKSHRSRKNHKVCRKEAANDNLSMVNKRNSSLFLFHALGKILHCKREASEGCSIEKLPDHLSHLERVPLVENPEEVFVKTVISAEGFSLFLHENYLAFTRDMESAANSAASFSEADAVSAEWTGRETLNEYSASLASRGLMFNLNLDGSRSRWETLHKPQYYNTIKESRSMSVLLKNSFRDARLSLEELETELVPYLAKLGIRLNNREQSEMVNQIGRMSAKGFARGHVESLCARDAVARDSLDISESIPSQPTLCLQSVVSEKTLLIGSDDEIEIEDPDS